LLVLDLAETVAVVQGRKGRIHIERVPIAETGAKKQGNPAAAASKGTSSRTASVPGSTAMVGRARCESVAVSP